MSDQIFADGPIDAPAKYVVPGSSEIIPIAVQALLDGTNASGDFVPTLVFRSQAGHVIARVPTATTVVAGGSAEVSWFPGVKATSATGGVAIVDEAFLYVVIDAPLSGNTLQTIGPGVATPIIWKGVQWHGGPVPGALVQPFPGDSTLTWAVEGPNMITLTVLWPANTYDRYIELTVANPSGIGTIGSPRLRTSSSPDGDVMTLSAVINGDPALPTSVTATAFNGSAGNQDINAEMTFWAVRPDVTIA